MHVFALNTRASSTQEQTQDQDQEQRDTRPHTARLAHVVRFNFFSLCASTS